MEAMCDKSLRMFTERVACLCQKWSWEQCFAAPTALEQRWRRWLGPAPGLKDS